MGVRVRYYRSLRGDEPVREYLVNVPKRERDDWDEALSLIATFGFDAPISFRQLDGKLWEIRIGRHRVAYVVLRGPEMILPHAFKKQSQRTSDRDLRVARKRADEVLGVER